MSDNFRRRVTDMPEHTDEEILALIQQAASDAEKATLMVLYQLNRNLIHNTNVTVEISDRQKIHEASFAAHRDEFTKHVTDERELFAKGIGAWKAYASVGMAIIVMGGYILNGHLNNLTKEALRNDEQEQRIGKLERDVPISREAAQRLSVLESQMSNMMGFVIDLQHRYDDQERTYARQVAEQKAKRK